MPSMDINDPPQGYEQRMVNMEAAVSGLRGDFQRFGIRMEALELICTPTSMQAAMALALGQAQIAQDAAAYKTWKARLTDKHTWFIVIGCLIAAKEPELAALLRSLA